MRMTYTVLGAGAIGGTFAAHLHLQGAEVQVIDADPNHVEAIRSHGIRIETPEGSLLARVPAYSLDEAPTELEAVLLAVKAQATQQAATWVAPRLSDHGWIASLQNGINEPLIAQIVGSGRTVAAFVDLFADVVAPGVVKDGGSGEIALGEFEGGSSPRVLRLAQDLSHWGTPVVTDNVEGYLWSKLGFGTMLTATALADADMEILLERHRQGLHGLARESLQVAVAKGISLESFDAFDPHPYLQGGSEADLATDKLVAWLRTQSKKRSGIWRDIAIRNRRTEVPAMWQPVLVAGAEHGLPTPLAEWMVKKITLLETGSIAMDEKHLFELDNIAGGA